MGCGRSKCQGKADDQLRAQDDWPQLTQQDIGHFVLCCTMMSEIEHVASLPAEKTGLLYNFFGSDC